MRLDVATYNSTDPELDPSSSKTTEVDIVQRIFHFPTAILLLL